MAASSPPATTPITPLPWRQVTVLLLFRISEPISFTVLFPFVYFMVRDFHVSDDPKEIGFYVGIVASVFSIAQLTTGMLWGFLSDRIGRRPILLMGVMGTVVCSVLFGLSKSLLWAVLVRILWGTLNGNASTSKTIMAEITDETNQAKGFSLLPMCWNLGSIMGPMIGGLLSNPVENIPSIFGDSVLFAEYPYLLPCLFCAVLSMGSWLMGFFFLEETLHKKLPQTRSGSLVSVPTYVGQFPQKVGLGLGGSPTLSLSSSSMSAASALVLAVKPNERQSLLGRTSHDASSITMAADYHAIGATSSSSSARGDIDSDVCIDDIDDDGCRMDKSTTTTPLLATSLTVDSKAPVNVSSSNDDGDDDDDHLSAWSSLKVAFNRDSLKCIAGYFGMSLLATILDDIYPIWSATEPELGGVGLSTQAIGFTLSISGLSVLFIQIVIYPKVQRVWGSLLCFRYGTLLYAGLALVFPLITLLEAGRHAQFWDPPSLLTLLTGSELEPELPNLPVHQPIRTVTWIALIAALIARVCGSTFGFTSVNMLINNSVPNREALGTVNGFAQSVGSLARAIGPMLAGAAWSWSLVNGRPFPFNSYFIFLLTSLIALATYLVTFTWHPRINQRAYAAESTVIMSVAGTGTGLVPHTVKSPSQV